MQISSDLLEFIRLLNKHSVHYLVVGGWAFSLHAKPRYTKDIDILIARSEKNAQSLMLAIEEFGFGSLALTAEDFLRPGYVIQLGLEPHRINILTEIVAVNFEDAWQRKDTVVYQDVQLNVIGKEDLLANKLAAGRDQDLVDAKFLQKLLDKD